MFRKYIFLGLMIMLGTVLVMLVVQSRKQESLRAQPAIPAEIVQTARTTATRVMAPGDLEVTVSGDDAAAAAGVRTDKLPPAAIGPWAIRNRGPITYHNTMLQITYLGNGGKILETHTRLFPETIAPGQTRTLTDLAPESVPARTIRCNISILYAEIGEAPPQ